jgi:hypothetical protein
MSDPRTMAAPDFLARLVVRARDGSTGIEPRLPSVFEPRQDGTIPFVAGWADRVAAGVENEEPPMAQIAAKPAERDRPAAPAPEAPGEVAGRQDAGSRRAMEPPLQGSTEIEPPRTPPITPVRNRRDSAETGNETRIEAPGRTRPPPLAPPEISLLELALRWGETHGSPPNPAASPQAPSPVSETVERRPIAAPVETAVQPHGDAGEARTLVPRARAGRQAVVAVPLTIPWRPRREESIAATKAPAEQVINVTIGRVEVRAVAAPTPSARAPVTRQRPGPLSLDDYLKQRGSGR